MTFKKIANSSDVPESGSFPTAVGGIEVLLCRYNGKLFAVDNRCSHMAEKLTSGRIRRGQIMCPVHGARFDLATGAACSLPATTPIGTHHVRENDGAIEINVDDVA